jgi:hypothetical protein
MSLKQKIKLGLFEILGGKGSGNKGHGGGRGGPGNPGGSTPTKGGGVSSGAGIDPSKLKRKDIFELKGKDLEQALNHERKDVVVKVVVTEWNASDLINKRTREAVGRLLEYTTPGKQLEHLHPLYGSDKESVTLYRGFNKDRKGARSYSYDKKIAKGFGSKLKTVEITENTPAIDVTKAIGVSEREVVVKEQ